MRRILAPVVLLVLAALGLSACTANAAPYAAKVDGQTISSSTLNDALHAVAVDSGLRCVLAAADSSSPGTGLSVEGAGSGTFSTALAANELTQLIELKALNAKLAATHLAPGSAQLALATARLERELTPGGSSTCTATGQKVLAGLTPSYRRALVSLEADEDVVGAHLLGVNFTQSGVLGYATAHPLAADLACVSAILVANKADAVAARQAIQQGASFATVAKAKSTDAQSAQAGGALGCIPPSELQPSLATVLVKLPTGVVSQPISFDSQYVLLEVTKRQAPTLAQATDLLLNAAATAEGNYIGKVVAKSDVSVDPAYGRWTVSNGAWQVVAPAGAPAKDLLNPGAVTPTTVAAPAAPSAG